MVKILGPVDNDGHVTALAGQAGAPAARGDGSPRLPTNLNRGDYVLNGFRHDDADRDLPIIGAIRRIRTPAAVIESHFSFDTLGKRRRQVGGISRVRRLLIPYARTPRFHLVHQTIPGFLKGTLHHLPASRDLLS